MCLLPWIFKIYTIMVQLLLDVWIKNELQKVVGIRLANASVHE